MSEGFRPKFTVGSLRAMLDSYSDDMPVVVDGYEGGYDDLAPEVIRVRPGNSKAPYYWGVFDDADGESCSFNALLLARHRDKGGQG